MYTLQTKLVLALGKPNYYEFLQLQSYQTHQTQGKETQRQSQCLSVGEICFVCQFCVLDESWVGDSLLPWFPQGKSLFSNVGSIRWGNVHCVRLTLRHAECWSLWVFSLWPEEQLDVMVESYWGWGSSFLWLTYFWDHITDSLPCEGGSRIVTPVLRFWSRLS